jgi:hypothetical protein
MVGCYTDATNPRVRDPSETCKWREHMAGKKSGNIWREKDGANKWCEKMAGKMRGKICTSFNENTSVLQTIKHNMIGDE